MSTAQRGDELEWERSVNKRYLRRADTAAEDAERGLDTVAAPSSTGWTGSGPRTPRPKVPAGPLRGRVALNDEDRDLGLGFYVGSSYVTLEGGITVVSWAAPVARLFFDRRDATASNPEGVDPSAVAARRTFKDDGQHLIDFEDECEPGADPETAFSRPSRLAIPPPPGTPASGRGRPPEPPGCERAQPSAGRASTQDRLSQADGRPAADATPEGTGQPRSAAPRSSASGEATPRGHQDPAPRVTRDDPPTRTRRVLNASALSVCSERHWMRPRPGAWRRCCPRCSLSSTGSSHGRPKRT